MDGQTYSLQNLLELIKTLHDGDEVPSHRIYKCSMLYECAKKVSSGDIVELGSGVGYGAISLAYGAASTGKKLSILTIDNWNNIGWAGDKYGNDEFEKFLKNRTESGMNGYIYMYYGKIETFSRGWKRPIGLLFWDLGIEGRMLLDISEWMEHIVTDGYMILHDKNDYSLGTIDVEDMLSKNYDNYKREYSQEGITIFRKVKP